MNNFSYVIGEEHLNQRLDHYLSLQLPEKSRSFLQKLIKEGHVTVNEKACKANYKLRMNDRIELTIPEPKPLDIVAEEMDLNIVYEDDDLLILNKPQGVVVHPAPGHYTGTLVNGLMHYLGDNLSGINGVKRPGIVHRIDKDTSGLLMICKNDQAHQSIAAQLKEHSIKRKYQAIVYHNFKEDEGTIEGPIGRHPVDRKKMAINYKNGKDAVTHYKVLERYGNFSLIEASLETGRTHQIRVHLTSIGHPLLGDAVYGPIIKGVAKSFKLQGQMLHAKVIGFEHPRTGEYMEFDSNLPEHFAKTIIKLNK